MNFQFYLEFIDVEKQLKVRFSPIFQSHLSENETVNSLHRYLDECQEIRSKFVVEQLVYLCARDSRTKSWFHGNAIPANLRMIQLHLSLDAWTGSILVERWVTSDWLLLQLTETATFCRIVFTYICFSFNFFSFFSYCNSYCNFVNLLDFSFRSVKVSSRKDRLEKDEI